MSYNAGYVFMIAAPSGAGKSSLVSALLAEDTNLQLSISATTRPPRPGEVNGQHYHFIEIDTFKSMRDNNALLEWAEVHGNYYGTPSQWIVEQIKHGKDVLLEIDWQGARQVREHFPSVIDIFILPPSIEELEKRLYNRGQDSDSVITRRLLAAGSEISHAPEFEYVIINNDFNTALEELKTIIAAARLRYQAQAKRHAELFSVFNIAFN